MHYSPLDSRRFDLKVYRHVAEEVDAQQVQSAILEERADLVILRVPSSSQHQLSRLDRIGFPYVVADTLVHYVSDLASPSDPLRNEGLYLEQVATETLPILESLVREIFPGYTNHYNSNPLLPLDDVLDGYVEWAANYALGEDTAAYLVRTDEDIVGFATCRFDRDAGVSEGVLYGVRPSAAGRGVYTDIIRLTRDLSRERGFDKMTVSTQTQNLAVQKAWIRSGFTVLRSEVTIHINSLLTATKRPERELTIVATPELSADYASLSGDDNPLHNDDGYARERGFDGAFAHGLLANSIVSRELGTEHPGPGTVILGFQYAFTKPLYHGHEYKVRFRFPVVRESGYHLAVAEIEDEEGTCMIAYCDVMQTMPKSS